MSQGGQSTRSKDGITLRRRPSLIRMDRSRTERREIPIRPKESPKIRERSKDRERDASKDRERDVSKDRERDTSKEREKNGEADKTKDKEKEKFSPVVSESEGAEKGHAIRTRLSTGSIHMNGTTTISVAREIENNQKLMNKIADETPAAAHVAAHRKRSHGTEGMQAAAGGSIPPKRRKIGRNDGSGEDNRNDYFCWLCHKEGTVICCELCPRVYHAKCLELSSNLPKDWACPECEKILRAECIDTRSKSMGMISIDTLCTLLKYALERMQHQGSDPFTKPVDLSNVPYYTDYIYNPMDLSQIERNIKKKMYGCTEAFLADAKWILHNCIIFNGTHHKLTSSAKMIIKICKHEMNEIELCPDCYWNSCIRKNDEWFSETCRTPHTLVWAKLKGYPFWPAKALREMDDQVDVRFFGAHDRSWVSTSQVYMLSRDIPTPAKNKKGGFENAMEELEIHIEKIKEKFGNFQYAPFRTPYDRNHVYFHNKMKQPFKKKGKQSPSPKGKAFETRQVVTQIKPKFTLKRSLTDTDKQSMASKTATAVKSKYSSIISTRKVGNVILMDVPAKKLLVSVDPKSKVILNKPKIEDVSVNTVEKIVKIEKTDNVSTTDESKPTGKTSLLNKEMKGGPSIVDKLQDKIKLMQKCEEEDDSEENNKQNNDDSTSQLLEKSIVKDVQQKEEVSSQPSQNNPEPNSKDLSNSRDENIEPENETEDDSPSKSIAEHPAEVAVADDNKIDVIATKDTDNSSKTVTDGSEAEMVTSEKVADVQKDVSPSKKLYLDNLAKTIQSCKAKLGIPGEKEIPEDDTMLERSDDEEEDDILENKETEEILNTEEKQRGDNHKQRGDNHKQDNDGEKGDKNSAMDVETIETEKGNLEKTNDKLIEEVKTIICDKEKIDVQKNLSESNDLTVESSGGNEPEKLDIAKSSMSAADEKIENEAGYQNLPLTVVDLNKNDAVSETASINVTKPATMSTPKDKVIEEPALLMEVESESDTDRLVIDMESEDKLHTITPTKKRPDKTPSVDKSVGPGITDLKSPGSDRVQIIAKAGKMYEIIGDKPAVNITEQDTSRSKETTSKEKHSSESQNLSSEFFQSAVEQTMMPSEPEKPTVKSPSVGSKVLAKILASPQDQTSPQDHRDQEPSTSSSSSPPSTKSSSHSEIITKFTKKLMSSIQETFEEMCNEFISTELQPKSITRNLQSEIQKMEWEQQQQVLELKHNFQLTMSEMKACWEAEKQRIVSEVNAMCVKDKEKAIEDTKKKQWCANCGKEAIFYCCWNTSYCDYPCQQSHWPQHMPNCMQSQQQQQQQTNENESPDQTNQSNVSPVDQPATTQETESVDHQKAVVTQPGTVDNPIDMDKSLPPSPARESISAPVPSIDDQRQRFQYLVGQPGIQTSSPMGIQQKVPILGGHGNINMQPMGPGYTPIQPNIGPNQITSNQMLQETMTMKRKPGCYNWTEKQMDTACNAILNCGMSVNKAAKVYNVPRVRLAERVAGKPVTLPPSSNQPVVGGGQPIIQYVHPPQPILSLPPTGVQPFGSPPQVGMQTIVQGHSPQAGLIQNRPVVQPNQSVLFPLQVRPHQQPVNVSGGIMPGNIVFTQAGPRPNNPFQVPGRF